MSVNRLAVHQLQNSNVEEWDEFVDSCADATFFHKAGWKTVIEKAFSHKAYYLYAKQDNKVVGVLPLGHVKSLLFGNALTSVPFCVCGGALGTTQAVIDALESSAVELAQSLRVDYLEIRNRDKVSNNWPVKELYVNFRKKIENDPELNMQAIPRKQRAMVRKGIKAGLNSCIDSNIDRLYDAYSESVRNLGTPVFSKRYFQILKETFGDQCESLVVVDQNNNLIAAVMSFYFKNEVLPYYGGGTAAARNVKGNDFMYWELMRRACERGIEYFDYGRSKKGTGSYSFKKNWGFEPQPLHYQFKLINAKAIPDINPLNPKYKLFIDVWKKLPVAATRIIGPHISRNLG